jgi:hypothetical protein
VDLPGGQRTDRGALRYPDELLNPELKHRVTRAAPARNKIALTRTAVGALRSILKQPQRVESYFGQKDVCYAAAQ